MLMVVIINKIGINKSCIKLPMKLIMNKIIGSNMLLVVMLPVYNISEINTGINVFINPIRLVVVSLTRFTISEKFVIIIVTIAMY